MEPLASWAILASPTPSQKDPSNDPSETPKGIQECIKGCVLEENALKGVYYRKMHSRVCIRGKCFRRGVFKGCVLEENVLKGVYQMKMDERNMY